MSIHEYVYINVKQFKRSSAVVLFRYVLRSLREENDRSTVAVDTGRMNAISSNAEADGKMSGSQDNIVSTGVDGEVS